MQQHRQLPRHRDYRTLPCVPRTRAAVPLTTPTQGCVRAERSQDVVRTRDKQAAQVDIARFRDAELRDMVARVATTRDQPEVRA
jgi:hypothetical protein